MIDIIFFERRIRVISNINVSWAQSLRRNSPNWMGRAWPMSRSLVIFYYHWLIGKSHFFPTFNLPCTNFTARKFWWMTSWHQQRQHLPAAVLLGNVYSHWKPLSAQWISVTPPQIRHNSILRCRCPNAIKQLIITYYFWFLKVWFPQHFKTTCHDRDACQTCCQQLNFDNRRYHKNWVELTRGI